MLAHQDTALHSVIPHIPSVGFLLAPLVVQDQINYATVIKVEIIFNHITHPGFPEVSWDSFLNQGILEQ